MTIVHKGSQTDSSDGTGDSITITHGLTINSGDLVVIYCNKNSTTGDITIDAGGAAWTEEFEESVDPSESARHGLFWKEAGASEPSSYTVDLGELEEARTIFMCFSGSSGWTVDSAYNNVLRTGSNNDIHCEASRSRTVSDDAVSLIFGGKDGRVGTAEAYTTCTDSYSNVVGNVTDQMTAGASRIFTTGKTYGAAEDLIIETADQADGRSDVTYSTHISFLEGSGGGNLTVEVPNGPVW